MAIVKTWYFLIPGSSAYREGFFIPHIFYNYYKYAKTETSKQIYMKPVFNNHLQTLPISSYETCNNYDVCLQESTAHYDRKRSHCSPFMTESDSRSSVSVYQSQCLSEQYFQNDNHKGFVMQFCVFYRKCLSSDNNLEYLIKSTALHPMLLSAPALFLNFIQCNKVLQKQNTVQLDKRRLLRLPTEYNSGNANLRMPQLNHS